MQELTHRVGIALGSNVEPRESHLLAARHFLCNLNDGQPEDFCFSRIYETTPVDCPPDSLSFLNAAAILVSRLNPAGLLDRLQDFERQSGRPAVHERNSPRTVDLDILFVGDLTMAGPRIEVPHPRARDRAFVLVPLAEIAPSLRLPGCDLTVSELASQLDLQGIRPWEGRL